MAGNIASEVTKFLKAEGQKQLRNVASDVVAGVVGGGGGRAREQVGRRTNLAGMMLAPGGAFTTMAVRGISGKAQNVATSAGRMVASGATPEAGAALQGSIDMAKNQVNAFTNLFTAPGIKSIGDFFSVMAEAPKNILSFGEALLSVTGRLKEVSPAFARISAEMEIRQLERDIKTGEQTGGSAARLSESLEELKDAMLPIQNDIYNVTADLITELVPVARNIYETLAPFLKACLLILGEILKIIGSTIVPILSVIIIITETMLESIKSIRFVGAAVAAVIDPALDLVRDMKRGIEDLKDDDDENRQPRVMQNIASFVRGNTDRLGR